MLEIPFALQCSIPEDRLLTLKNSVNGSLKSATVTNIPEFEYSLRIFPNGRKDENRGQTCIYLLLKLKNVKKVVAAFTFSIESADYSSALQYVYERTIGHGKHICKTDEFFDATKKYIIDGKCVVKVKGLFKFECEDAPAAAIAKQKWDGGELGDVTWQKDDTKDFTIVVDGTEIKVHKFILAVRSEVFTAMLNSNMKEVKENKVAITDFSFNVVDTAVKLIYHCTFTSSLSLDELMLLLQFFDKYDLPTLKAKVEPLLMNRISAATIVRLTNCSVQTISFKLKQKCMEFLSTCFKKQTPLSDIKILDKDVLLEVIDNSLFQIVEIKD